MRITNPKMKGGKGKKKRNKDEDGATPMVGSWRFLMCWVTVFPEIEKECTGRRRRSEKGWGAGGEMPHLSREKCAFVDKMPQGGHPCFQHRSEWKSIGSGVSPEQPKSASGSQETCD